MGEQFIPHTNTRKWLAVLGMVAVISAVTVGLYFVFTHKPAKPVPMPFNQHQAQIDTLERQSVPVQPSQRLSYYSQLAQHYDDLHNNSQALKNYLKAQEVADTMGDPIVFYVPIAEQYKAMGDKTKAKTYYQKEIDYLTQWAKVHPDQAAGNQQAIQVVQKAIRAL